MFVETLFSKAYWQAVLAGESHLSFLWELFLQEHHDIFVMAGIGLGFIVLMILVLYLLPRGNLRRLFAVGIACLAGMSFLVQVVYTVSIPEMYTQLGKGDPRACPVLQRDSAGRLIYRPHQVMVAGRERTAMVAEKNVYFVETDPLTGEFNGQETVGLFLKNATALRRDFPVLCGVLLEEGGQQLLDRLHAYKTPVPLEAIQSLIVESLTYQDMLSLKGSKRAELLAASIAVKLGDQLLPATPQDLTEAILKALDDPALDPQNLASGVWVVVSDARWKTRAYNLALVNSSKALFAQLKKEGGYDRFLSGQLSSRDLAEQMLTDSAGGATPDGLDRILLTGLETARVRVLEGLPRTFLKNTVNYLSHEGWRWGSLDKIVGYMKERVSSEDVLALIAGEKNLDQLAAELLKLFPGLKKSEQADISSALQWALEKSKELNKAWAEELYYALGNNTVGFDAQELSRSTYTSLVNVNTIEYLRGKDVAPLFEAIKAQAGWTTENFVTVEHLAQILDAFGLELQRSLVIRYSYLVKRKLGEVDFSGYKPVVVLPGDAPYYLLPIPEKGQAGQGDTVKGKPSDEQAGNSEPSEAPADESEAADGQAAGGQAAEDKPEAGQTAESQPIAGSLADAQMMAEAQSANRVYYGQDRLSKNGEKSDKDRY